MEEMKDTIVVIGRFTIRKVGVAFEVYAMKKFETRHKDGTITKGKKPTRLASHGYLTWDFQTIIRVGNKNEKAEAKKHLDILNGKFGEIIEKNNDRYMDKYRVIEKNYISNGFK